MGDVPRMNGCDCHAVFPPNKNGTRINCSPIKSVENQRPCVGISGDNQKPPNHYKIDQEANRDYFHCAGMGRKIGSSRIPFPTDANEDGLVA